MERYVLETLRETERVRLKLLTPLGVLRHLLKNNIGALDSRLTVVEEDSRVLKSIRDQLTAYSQEMRTDSERYLIEVRNVLYELERRGRAGSNERSALATRISCATRTQLRIAFAWKS